MQLGQERGLGRCVFVCVLKDEGVSAGGAAQLSKL